MFVDLEAVSKTGAFRDPAKLTASGLLTPGVRISAVGGHVISKNYTPTVASARAGILRALGEGSLLTYGNPNGTSREAFAAKAIKDKHLWALRAFSLTVLYVDTPRCFRDDCAFSRRFHLSWMEREATGFPIVFTAQGSLRDWRKFLDHKNDASYKSTSRQWMQTTYNMMSELCPELFAPNLGSADGSVNP